MGTYEDFVHWLRQELSDRKWSMAELARRGGISVSHISRLMSGDRPPGSATCRAIARAFRIPADDVFRRAGILPGTHTQRGPDGVEELVSLYRSLPTDERRRLLIIARALFEAGENVDV